MSNASIGSEVPADMWKRLDFIWLAGSAFNNRQTGWEVLMLGASCQPTYTMRFVKPNRA